MEFGIFHEFLTTQTGSQARAFVQSFAQIEAAESWGLDVVWLAEIHMNPTRSLLSAPLTVAGAIAARTHRIKIGTAIQILPPAAGHPLRLAAAPDAYEESQDRFAESLDIIKAAWTQPVASYRGRYHCFDNFTLVPRPLQQPHPEIRIAASQHETYATIGELGYSVFSAVRASPLTELAYHTKAYRDAWAAVGHRGKPRAFLQVPHLCRG